MAQVAVVKASDLSRENRWDAGFHIALAKVRDRVEELKAKYTAEECREKLHALSFADKSPLRVLSRTGSINTWSDRALTSVVKEYPHLSMAIMEQNLSTAIKRVNEVISRNEKYRDALLDLQSGAGE